MEKKLQLLIAVILFAVTLTNISLAGDRNILLERFTSSTCGPCATANPALDAFLLATDPNRLSSVSYHMNWPAPGNEQWPLESAQLDALVLGLPWQRVGDAGIITVV